VRWEAAVATDRRASARIEFPNDLEIVLTREFDAPIQLVFDVLSKPENLRKTFAPYGGGSEDLLGRPARRR
jgi:hypothetical protein